MTNNVAAKQHLGPEHIFGGFDGCNENSGGAGRRLPDLASGWRVELGVRL
ncbi:MAG: hypothetical protein U0992_07125 [Planctomycetaceae bacterium]